MLLRYIPRATFWAEIDTATKAWAVTAFLAFASSWKYPFRLPMNLERIFPGILSPRCPQYRYFKSLYIIYKNNNAYI